jgi:hypothetical protein
MSSFLGQWTGQSNTGTYIFVNINQSGQGSFKKRNTG